MPDHCKFCGAVTINNCRSDAEYEKCAFLADIAADEKYGSAHASDCVRNSAPALPVAPCNCGATLTAADTWAKDEQNKRHTAEEKLLAARSEITVLREKLEETEAKAKMRALALLVMEEKFEQSASDAAGWHSEYKNERREKNAAATALAEAEARGYARGLEWQPIGPEHKDGRCIIAIDAADPDNRAIVWWDGKAETHPWIGSAGDHDYMAGAFTHAIPFPDPPSLATAPAETQKPETGEGPR